MLVRLALLFVLIPVLELALLVQLGQAVGFWPTMLLVILTGVAGAALARREGLRVLRAVRQEMAAGRVPAPALLDGLAVVVGGAFLLTPGLITDVAGLSLLIPPARRFLQKGARAWLERQVRTGRIQVMGLPGVDIFGGRGAPPRADAGLDPTKEVGQRRRDDASPD